MFHEVGTNTGSKLQEQGMMYGAGACGQTHRASLLQHGHCQFGEVRCHSLHAIREHNGLTHHVTEQGMRLCWFLCLVSAVSALTLDDNEIREQFAEVSKLLEEVTCPSHQWIAF